MRICAKPTGASLATPSVPRKSKSPSAKTAPDFSGMSSAVATALSVTPAQRFKQHVARAQFKPRPAGARMKPRNRERTAGLEFAGDIRGVECAPGLERNKRRLGVG